ncbi:MAG: nucleotide sugar dehydrogenase [Chloroflexota bacterium]|nr:nucleotide sugar dehydrogenase [Chloroflexota bacterium]
MTDTDSLDRLGQAAPTERDEAPAGVRGVAAQDARAAIIGLGYVGLPLGLSLLDAGLDVVGVDANAARLEALAAGRSPIDDVSDGRLGDALRRGFRLRSTADPGLEDVDAMFVCVPTPVTPAKDPDLTAVLNAAALVARSLRPGQLVILQSTTYPGTTSGPFRAQLEQSGLVAGRDFGLAYAPERVNPGDPQSLQATLPKLVGGLTVADTQRAARLLRRIGGQVVELSSPDAAEMAKLLENVFRNVNIALVNQLALLCERMGLDVWEVIDAAATKPFGFMPFRPGPGVGGHCIPVDPYYLSWRARQFGLTDRFVELAGDINARMPHHVADLVAQALNERSLPVRGARVGVIGVAFKSNVRDARNSPAAEVLAELARRGARLAYHDPHVPAFRDAAGAEYESVPLPEVLATDVVLVLVRHRDIDWPRVYEGASLVVDTVNSSTEQAVRPRQVLRLGAGWS